MWEDAYITLRHAVHLCAGDGLTYEAGQRIQGFSSPLAALLMAATAAVTGCGPDAPALWLFRLLGLGALITASWLLADALRLAGVLRGLPLVLPLVAFALESKTLAFSVNGMETGLVVMFAAGMLRELARERPGKPWHMGLLWVGMLWARADGALYVGLAGLASLLVAPGGRRDAVRWLLTAGAVAILGYLPWVIFAWNGYGTPLPLTVLAKAPAALPSVAAALARVPSIWANVFLPPYAENGGWDAWRPVGALVAAVASLRFLLPGSALVRRGSFVMSGGVAYLALMPSTYPWYYPIVALFSLPTLASFLGTASRLPGRAGRIVPAAFAAVFLSSLAWLAVDYGLLARATRRIVEKENRREIGLWLRQQASAGDRVFLECAGYIGFFSGLSMLDYPGLVSPEVLRVRRSVDGLVPVATALRAEWMVLRPVEIEGFARAQPGWLAREYETAAIFDVSRRLREAAPAHPAALYDATFVVFVRRALRD